MSCNVMMLLGPLHTYFGTLKLALEPTAVENKYQIRKFFDLSSSDSYPWYYQFLPEDELASFSSHDRGYPLPDRLFLETHFLIATILHTTGRGEIVERIQRDYGKTGTLANDGSTDIASLLSTITLTSNQCDTHISRGAVLC